MIQYLLLFSILFSTSLSALEHPLVKITNDEDAESFIFVIETDSKNQEITRFFKDLHDQHGVRLEREVLTPQMFQTDSGLILKQQDGRIVVRMISENFAPHNGGHILIDTLYNGVYGSRREYEYEVTRAGSSWELVKNGTPIRNMHLRSKKVLAIGTVGIADIINQP